ncbi:membrane protein of unknown function [Methylorubrum extorquens]|uniref:Major facilitator superfamily (MFS) profile domain-containing protein n=1 Tax=Methylorubrum extorquens TaxID=408 RepID=A0A2N9ATE3_METEX|nr:membrane protein of unknown function [Methylorubrum extorquens]
MALSSIAPERPVPSSNRWLQIIFGVICMVAAANIQYAWTLFVPEIQKTFGWDRAAIQVAFTIFVVVQTWLTPIEGYFIDKYGPSRVVMFGGLMTGAAWVMNSYATSLTGFYIGSVLGGIGVGCVYATCINNALKWFPDKRGLAVGLTAGGYGAGSALTIIPIAKMIDAGSYAQAFFTFGLIQGTVIILASIFMRSPAKDEVKFSTKVLQSRRDYTLGEALRTPVFYVMLLMFTCTVTGGLMAVAQLGVIATDLGVKNFQVNLYFFAMAALPFALMLDRVMNGISRPLFGFISDRIGREKTMFIAFAMEGIGIVALGYFGSNPLGVRDPVGHRVPGLGRSVLAVQRHGRRHLRFEAYRQDLRRPLLRQGLCRAVRAGREPDHAGDGHVVDGALHGGDDGPDRSRTRHRRAAADAEAAPRRQQRGGAERSTRPRLIGPLRSRRIGSRTRKPRRKRRGFSFETGFLSAPARDLGDVDRPKKKAPSPEPWSTRSSHRGGMVGATGIEPVTPTMSTYSGRTALPHQNQPFPEAGQCVAIHSRAAPCSPI